MPWIFIRLTVTGWDYTATQFVFHLIYLEFNEQRHQMAGLVIWAHSERNAANFRKRRQYSTELMIRTRRMNVLCILIRA